MPYKTYPLNMDEEFHQKLKTAAFNSDMSMKDYIQEAVKEKIERDSSKQAS